MKALKLISCGALILLLIYCCRTCCCKSGAPMPQIERIESNKSIDKKEKSYLYEIKKYQQAEIKTKQTLIAVQIQLQEARVKNKELLAIITVPIHTMQQYTEQWSPEEFSKTISSIKKTDKIKDSLCDETIKLQSNLIDTKEAIITATTKQYLHTRSLYQAIQMEQQVVQKQVRKIKRNNGVLKLVTGAIAALLIKKIVTH
jgi:hypothetical protein